LAAFRLKFQGLYTCVDITCDRYVVKLEGESPLRALVRRTVREGKGVHREVESEESRIQNADLTNRKCI
jgi:hypothetical protein